MTLFKRTTLTVIGSVGLAAGAIIRYPGGTPLDRATAGYSFAANFLSDLGMTVAHNGESNRRGGMLFVASLLTLVIGLG